MIMFSSLFKHQPLSRAQRAETKERSTPKPDNTESSKIFQDVFIVKQLNKAKFPVYLVCSKVNNKNYAMKTFPHENGRPHTYYENEIRFANLNHDNVIRNYSFENERKTRTGVHTITNISLKVMEYAPYGDFYDLTMKYGEVFDEKLVRSYFKQMIEGLEYLQQQSVAHLDLKLENLLIGEDFILKIADFDLSQFAGDSKIISHGTKFYRAPELSLKNCKDTFAADIYSAGIVLFTMKSHGVLPHAENNLISGVNFSQLLHTGDPKFWKEHCKVQKKTEAFFDEDFKELFLAMTNPDPEKRATIQDIKKSKWYNGACCTPEEIKNRMNKINWK